MFSFKWLQRLRARKVTPPSAVSKQGGDAFGLVFRQPSSIGRVVLIGNCVAEMVATGLSTVPTATRLFNFEAVPLHLKGLGDADVRRALANADFVFVQGVVARHLDQINRLRPKDSKLINLPDAVLRSLWPFDGDNGYRDEAVLVANPSAPKHHHDGALARLRQIEPNKEKRLSRYRELDFDLADRIDRVIETQQRFFDEVDKTNEAQLGKFLAQNYRDRQVFYNSTHPTAIVFQKVCEFCWGQLGLPGQTPAIEGLDVWKKGSVPVHPAIAKRLGLKWANERTRYTCGAWGTLTWEAWVRAYIKNFG
jgi:hypothetical protein